MEENKKDKDDISLKAFFITLLIVTFPLMLCVLWLLGIINIRVGTIIGLVIAGSTTTGIWWRVLTKGKDGPYYYKYLGKKGDIGLALLATMIFVVWLFSAIKYWYRIDE